jgi:hypothetical protein
MAATKALYSRRAHEDATVQQRNKALVCLHSARGGGGNTLLPSSQMLELLSAIVGGQLDAFQTAGAREPASKACREHQR